MRKPRSDSKLLNLPEEQQAQLGEWLLSGMPYHQAQELVEKQFGLRVPLGSFTAFYQQVCEPHLLQRRSRAVQMAQSVAEEASSRPGTFDPATIDQLRQKAFELSISPNANPKDVKALFMLVLKARDQELTERRIVLLEKKAAQADQASDVVASELSSEEKQQRLKAIFGIGG